MSKPVASKSDSSTDITGNKKSERLRELLLSKLALLEGDFGSSDALPAPEYELTPRDYLRFAESELSGTTDHNLINCVGHLKRALDCQLDTFLHMFNLLQLFRKRNLKFEKKLEFLTAAGVFSSRSLARLNTIRNRMEHDYEVPKIADIESYFDLTTAFVSVLELTALLNTELGFGSRGSTKRSAGYLLVEYKIALPSIVMTWTEGDNKEVLQVEASTEIDEFAFFFRAVLLLSQKWINLTSDAYFLSQMKK
ncbi:MAG TPA: hypothetical protein VGO50_05450 [Pyrinomonadaceae bacterium]|jgi:hypothetical protein|nr:hypothetical protein [Pyrinomonadaceae bacterium]